MPRPTDTFSLERRRARRWYGVAWVWTVIALGLPAVALATGTSHLDDPLMVGLFFVIIGVLSNTVFQLTGGKEPIHYAPDGQALVLAAMFLHPVSAMVACSVQLIDVFGITRDKIKLWKIPLCAGAGMLATGITSAAVHVMSANPHGKLLLPVALVAALLYEVVIVSLWTVIFEAKGRGIGRSFLESCRKLAPLNIGINSIAVVVIAPFARDPIGLVTVLTLFQVVTFVASRVSTSENLHREKSEHLKTVFTRYVPSHVADQLAESGDEIELGGQEREITVLFCDIRGFTSWAEGVKPELVITELNAVLGGLSGAVMEANGTLDKYTGDGLMAFWGAPLEQPDHAELALSCGIDMLMRLKEANRDRVMHGLPPFAIGIGIHSGPAVVGNVGHEDRLDYTAIGDTVNTSARLEAATKELKSPLLISRQTWQKLPDDKRRLCDWAGAITVKGRSQPVDVLTLPDAFVQASTDPVPGDNPFAFGLDEADPFDFLGDIEDSAA